MNEITNLKVYGFILSSSFGTRTEVPKIYFFVFPAVIKFTIRIHFDNYL